MAPIIINQEKDLCGLFFSTLVELPPALRSCYENIIFHSNWTGSNPDFNIYLQEYNNQIDYIREHGVKFNDKIYKFKIHILIADAPARAKACNMNQFNDKFACIKCLHPTYNKNHTTIYPTFKF